jgi:hypothetical protein
VVLLLLGWRVAKNMMKEKFRTAGLAAVLLLAGAGCSRQSSNGASGSADRTAKPVDSHANGGNSFTPPTGPDSSRGTEGSTAGAASGSLQTHERGGGSTGTTAPTRPEAGVAPNVDPQYAHKNRTPPAPARDPSVPDPQGKQ